MPATVRNSAEPMNKAAMRRRSGVGGVIPKVMMKASAMDSRNFKGAAFIVGAILTEFEIRNRDGTKVTLPMGSTDGARLGVPSAVRATETIGDSNELKIPGLG